MIHSSLKISLIALTCLLAPGLRAGSLPSAQEANFSFESGAANWHRVDGTFWKTAQDSRTGVGALQFIAYKGIGKDGAVTRDIWNQSDLPVKAGEKYDASCFVKGLGVMGGWAQGVAVRFYTDSGSLIKEIDGPAKSALHFFDESRVIVTAPQKAAYARIGAKVYITKEISQINYLRFDDFSFLPADQAAKERKERDAAMLAGYYAGTPAKPVRYDSEDKGAVTEGELSLGKFYTFSRPADVMYPDHYSNQWTAGAVLTDEDLTTDGEPFEKDRFVGWRGTKPVEITVDLGRPQTVEEAFVNGVASNEAYFLRPDRVEVSTSLEKDGQWQNFGVGARPSEKSGVLRYSYEIPVKGAPRQARYVRFTVYPEKDAPNAAFLLLDGVRVLGKIKNTWRNVPSDGAFHGAFPTAVGHTAEQRKGRSGMVVDMFEEEVGKKLSMVLWYQAMEPGRGFAEIQSLRQNLTKDFYGHRYLVIGWLPKTKLNVIANGDYDEFLTEYFTDSMNPEVLQGIDSPIWFRPMNEFNGGWVPYGLEPKTFRQAWRRMYNIAEQLGAADKHLFVWSPNHRSYPDEDWNKMENYWPGDQYVDWVGISAYPPSKKFITDMNRRYPVVNIEESYELYPHKPYMITEGGFADDIDRVRWVQEWFDGLKKERPRVRAVIWENHEQRSIGRSPEARDLYRKLVQDPYWLSETWDGKSGSAGEDQGSK